MNVKVTFTCGHSRTLRNVNWENMRQRLSPLFLTRYGMCLKCGHQRKIYSFTTRPARGERIDGDVARFVNRGTPVGHFASSTDPGRFARYTFACCHRGVREFAPNASTRNIMGPEQYGQCPYCYEYAAYTIRAESGSTVKTLSGAGYLPGQCRVTLGCDPEFEIPGVSNVDGFLLDNGFDGDLRSDEIGADGAGEQVELRPAPSTEPEIVMQNIHELLGEFASRYGVDLDPRGENYACGGHIHIGLLVNGDRPSLDTYLAVKALDAFIGIPSVSLNGGARGSYAEMGSTEDKRYGFEYRTPPAAIFADRHVLSQVFDITRHIMMAALCGGFEYKTTVDGKATEPSYKKLLGYVPTLFLDLCKAGADAVPDSLMAAWEVELPAKPARETVSAEGYRIARQEIRFEQDLYVHLSDTWEYRSQIIFADEILRCLRNHSVAGCYSARFELFGYSSDRGDVVSRLRVELPAGFTLFDSFSMGAATTTIGIPAACRYGHIDQDRTALLARAVAEHIMIVLKERDSVRYSSL